MRFSIRHALLVLLAAAGTIATGCSLLPSPKYNDPNNYDIGIPDILRDLPYEVKILPVAADTATRYKMVYRVEDNRLKLDEYNRWTLPPGPMLTKYLRMAFAAHGSDSERPVTLTVAGTIYVFEADFCRDVVRLCMEYKISSNIEAVKPLIATVQVTEPVKNQSADAVADAMSLAAANFKNDLRSSLDKVYEECQAAQRRMENKSSQSVNRTGTAAGGKS